MPGTPLTLKAMTLRHQVKGFLECWLHPEKQKAIGSIRLQLNRYDQFYEIEIHTILPMQKGMLFQVVINSTIISEQCQRNISRSRKEPLKFLAQNR